MFYWLKRPWRQALDFRGRATRREYWMFVPLLYALWIVLIAIIALVLTAAGADQDAFDMILVSSTLVSMVLGFIPLLSASVRRLHDHDKTGWLFLLAFVPLVGWIFFLIMMLTPGSPGENGYGSDPRKRGFTGEDAYAVFS